MSTEGRPAAQATPKPARRTILLRRLVQVVIFFTILAGVLIVVDTRNGSLRRLVMGSSENRIGLSADAKALVRANSAFAFDLYQRVRKSEDNLFFSPYSVSMALAMVYGGARGETQQQMADVLHLPVSQQGPHPAFAQLQTGLDRIQDAGDVTIRVANSLWVQEGCTFLRDYLSLVETHYGSSITSLDYGNASRACERINKWVEQRTAGKISDVIAPGGLGELPALTLVNAIYFKGNWQVQFSRSSTREMTFHVTPLKSISTPMMTGAQKAGYAEAESFQILELAYVGRSLSMLILLPKEAYGLEGLEADLSVENLARWRNHMRSTVVDVFLPKFKMTRSAPLDQTLQAMGMIDVFSRPSALQRCNILFF